MTRVFCRAGVARAAMRCVHALLLPAYLLRDAFGLLLFVVCLYLDERNVRGAWRLGREVMSTYGYRWCISRSYDFFNWRRLRAFHFHLEITWLRSYPRIALVSRFIRFVIWLPPEGFGCIIHRPSDASIIAHHFNNIARPRAYLYGGWPEF